jgi:glutaredoxin domain-containing cysteine-rich protein 1
MLPPLPQLYVNGESYGGLAELERLNENEQLVRELQEFRIDLAGVTQQAIACDDCQGRRFIVCDQCNGSRKGREVFGTIMKCAYCNENGLMPCPSCNFENDDEFLTHR